MYFQGDVEVSGGGEGMAEPIEDGELEESTTKMTPTAPVIEPITPLTNGTNGVVEVNGQHMEEDELISPVCERKVSYIYVQS